MSGICGTLLPILSWLNPSTTTCRRSGTVTGLLPFCCSHAATSLAPNSLLSIYTCRSCETTCTITGAEATALATTTRDQDPIASPNGTCTSHETVPGTATPIDEKLLVRK